MFDFMKPRLSYQGVTHEKWQSRNAHHTERLSDKVDWTQVLIEKSVKE